MSDTNSYDSALKEFVADSDQRGNNGHRSDRTAFDGLIDARHGPIGRVVASEREPSGAHIFHFWAGEEQRSLDVGHIIVGFSEDAAVIGVVDEPRRYSDLVSFLDDFYDRHLEQDLAAEPPTRRPEILVFRVNVLRTRHTREDVTSRRPVVAGPVYFATTDAIDFALGRADFDGEAIPALLHTNGNAERNESGDIHLSADGNAVFQRSPIWIDEEYLLGPEAGHANWTGQSGLATKTSHALFLTSAIFQRMEAQGSSIAALLFNVKGPDLLWLDKPIVPDTEDERTRFATHGLEGLSPLELSAYEGMGLNPAPFEHVRVFAPFKPGQQPANQNVVHLSGSEFHGRLNTLRDDPGERHKVYPVLWGLKPLLFMPHKVFDRGDLDDKMFGLIADMRDREQIVSLRQMEQRLREIVSDLDESGGTEWNGHHKFTVLKALNRFNGLENKFAGLLTDGEVDYGSLPQVDETFTNQEVRVVDIANCNTNVQELLVTSAINEVWKRAERQELGVDKLIIFVDELNKHAAAGSESALRNTLVDIAARGRHLNVVLFGAQQFRSKVDDEILGNCGTSFYGRVGDEEITNASYRSLTETTKTELLGLPKGNLLVRHAHFRAPLFGTFPRPPVVPGMDGQRLYNDAGSNSYPGDPLYHLIKRLDPGSTVTIGEIRTETSGLSPETVELIYSKVEQSHRRITGTTGGKRVNAENMCRNAIRNARSTANRS